MKSLRLGNILFISACSTLSFAGGYQSPCMTNRTQRGWHVYVDKKYRFCFEYPPQYKSAPTATAPGIGSGIPVSERRVRLSVNPQPVEHPDTNEDETDATINVIAYGTSIHLSDLSSLAPTGWQDVPPERVPTMHQEFYYYGPGGGGVAYPDSYYFGLRGRTFSIQFFSPSDGHKTPAAATKQIEPKVLASFRRF